ncbi:helix-turn-helix domain-containing protein [Dactylosporangium sp. NPDC051484]|uniref:TetR/AcrR family transcriptional regulator n=1 Tax=Dactylosporangium sp. NPDC051484 TaxID=3154942 RepID=UPI00344D9D71
MGAGLRERKKSATRQALHEAAVALSIKHGLDKVTVEAIADAAEVSRRTFSNYFASKEEALLHGDQLRMRLLVDAVRDRPAAEPPWAALTGAALEVQQRLGARDPRWVTQVRMVRRHPALAAQQVSTYASMEDELTAQISSRAPWSAQCPVRARLMAAAFMAAMRVAVQDWLDRPPGTQLADVMREALAEMGAAFR